AESGATVIGLDVDPTRVARVRAGESFVEDVPTSTLAGLVTAGRLTATDDVAALKDVDAILICVPTPLGKSKEPDISYIVSAADAVAGVIRRGQLVVLESTTYPGTTQEILLPRFQARGLRAGEDFFLAFSPERIDPGNRRYTLREIPKVVGGLTPACRELAATLYARITRQVVPVSGPETAEMVKLFENTFRSVNIALVNEFAIMCRRLGISVWELTGAAAVYHDPFVPSLMLERTTLESIAWRDADLAGRDLVLILTPHNGYDWGAIVREARLVIDTRNATADVLPAPHVIRL